MVVVVLVLVLEGKRLKVVGCRVGRGEHELQGSRLYLESQTRQMRPASLLPGYEGAALLGFSQKLSLYYGSLDFPSGVTCANGARRDRDLRALEIR